MMLGERERRCTLWVLGLSILPQYLCMDMRATIAPRHSWDTLGSMTFFHACNESGLWSDRALDTITKFPFVTIEKAQGFNAPCPDGYKAPCAEQKISAQIQAIKARNSSIATVFYMNLVLDWYFYQMSEQLVEDPSLQLYDSFTGKPAKCGGDPHFDPPKGGMPAFDHSNPAMREYWKAVCINATLAGADGCFADSSQPATHGTQKQLNASKNAAFEAGKVNVMSDLTEHFGGSPGKPYAGSNGVVIGKKPDQQGINAYQIEFFEATDALILELMNSSEKGYLVEAHAGIDTMASKEGCNYMEDIAAAFLIGAGNNSFFGSGPWISPNIEDVEQRWCPPLFDKPLGPPTAAAVKSNGIWTRHFTSGTIVTFNTNNNTGMIRWATDA